MEALESVAWALAGFLPTLAGLELALRLAKKPSGLVLPKREVQELVS